MHRQLESLLALYLAISNVYAHEQVHKLDNANHVFNAIHSSMRQWGSSLSPGHNGMSFFMATVSKGQQLYHGTNEAERVNGTEWLAFEPEHALQFARSHRGPPPGRGGPPGPDGEGWHPPERMEDASDYPPWLPGPPRHDLKARHPHDDRPLTHTAAQRARADSRSHQEPLREPEPRPEEDSYGYLHTYRAKNDLRLLYIDGQSAAKSDKGTLDSQDIVLLHESPPPMEERRTGHPRARDGPGDGKKRRPGGPMNESYRSIKLCEMAEKEWEGKVDGFLRMELGFEIILCSFEDDLEVERITQAQGGGGGGGFGPGRDNDPTALNYYQAVASRFDGIGGDRVRVNYQDFITLFAYPEAHYFNDAGLPRAVNSTKALAPVLAAITKMILDSSNTAVPETNWQSIADLVVARYSDRIERLVSEPFPDLSTFQKVLSGSIRPYIDYGDRNTTLETFRCATQYLPHLEPPKTLASHAILSVTSTLCSQLLAASEQENLEDAVATIQNLQDWLGWSSWKRCRGCSYDEVCFVPIWPMGGEEDMAHPRCISNASEIGRGYWGGHFGGPPAPPF